MSSNPKPPDPPKQTQPAKAVEIDKGREEFIERHIDEMIGLLVGAFARTEMSVTHRVGEQSYADDGRFMMQQMRRARALLGKMYDDLKGRAK